MAVRVAINGFGRIGRTILRTSLGGGYEDVEITAINDIARPDMLAYLFEFDSTFGPYRGEVCHDGGSLTVANRRIRLTAEPDIAALDLSDIDIVMECTGRAGDRRVAEAPLRAGARKVLVSGPSATADYTAVLGANEAGLDAGHRIVSNASCTTNALAPLAKLLDAAYGIETGWMTTIHCYTGSQPTVDAPARDFARSRAAALSMVPTTTSAQNLLGVVLPALAGRIEGAAVRVPVASVSAVDLTVMLRSRPARDAINHLFAKAGGVIGTTDRPLVSSDLRARPESIVMALPETRVTAAGLVRVFGWYDNEWGYSNRMLDMARLMARTG